MATITVIAALHGGSAGAQVEARSLRRSVTREAVLLKDGEGAGGDVGWLGWGNTPNNMRLSPLTQITTSNIDQLGRIFTTGAPGGCASRCGSVRRSSPRR